MSIQNNMSDQPIILCHAACTGGSLIYRSLVSAFNFVGISELGHARQPSSNAYMPLDPEALLFGQGLLSPSEFADVFFQRICHCESLVKRAGQQLLIREHSHQYFFDPHQDAIVLNSVSWIKDAYQREFGKALYCLVSVRDPIDSWLGLRSSFPNEKILDFDQYCEMYLNFLDRVEATERAYLFKYEDFVRDPNEIFNKISDSVGCEFLGFDSKKGASVASSGNSGRQGDQITVRPRRPFTRRLIKNAVCSGHYKRLCERLEYVHVNDEVSRGQQYVLLKNDVQNLVHNFVDICRKPFNWLLSNFPLIRD